MSGGRGPAPPAGWLTLAPIERSNPTPCTEYEHYRPHVRLDFSYSCAYCSLMEREAAGIRFVLDHYRPKVRYLALRTEFTNLLYACERCNLHKGERPPPAVEALGYRFFKADQDDWDTHFGVEEAAGSVRLVPRTQDVGEYTERALFLNNANLRALREARRQEFDAVQFAVRGVSRLQGLRLDDLPASLRARFVALRPKLANRVEGLKREDAAELARSAWVDPGPAVSPDEQKANVKYFRKLNRRARLVTRP